MAILFSDDFNRADSSTIGGNWVEVSGNWQITSNELLPPTADGSFIVNTSLTTGQDEDYSHQAQIRSAAANGCGIVARYTDTSNHYRYVVIPGSSNNTNMQRVTGGSVTVLASNSISMSTGVDYTFKIDVNGTAIKGYFEGVEKISVTDSDHSSGDFGFRIGGASQRYYDDCLVEGAGGGGWTNIAEVLGVGEANVAEVAGVSKASIAEIAGKAV